jgi:hypothetical protein
MLFELKKFVSLNPISQLIKLTKDERQKQFIKELSKSCNKGDSVIYCLVLENNICGFVGLSASKIDSIPCINVEYIYVVEDYRKMTYMDLDNQKISEFLISFCISLAVKLKNSIGLRWLTLMPDNKDLEEFYIETFDFTQYKAKKDKITYLFIAV